MYGWKEDRAPVGLSLAVAAFKIPDSHGAVNAGGVDPRVRQLDTIKGYLYLSSTGILSFISVFGIPTHLIDPDP